MPRIIKASPQWTEINRDKSLNFKNIRNPRGLAIVRVHCKTFKILEYYSSISDAARKLNTRRFDDTKNFKMLKSFISYASLKFKRAYDECYCVEEDIPKYKEYIKKLHKITIGNPQNSKYFTLKDSYKRYQQRCTATGAEKLYYSVYKRIIKEYMEWQLQYHILNNLPFRIPKVGNLTPYKTTFKHYATKALGGKYHGLEWVRSIKPNFNRTGFAIYRNYEPSRWVKDLLNSFRFNELNCKEK